MEFLMEQVLKWLIPILLAATLGVLIRLISDTYKRGQESREQAEWDSHAKAMQQEMDSMKEVSQQRTTELQEQINALQSSLELLLQSNRLQNLRGLQRGGKELLAQEEISDAEYLQFEEEYKVYKECGGDGWADKIHTAIEEKYQNQLLQ